MWMAKPRAATCKMGIPRGFSDRTNMAVFLSSSQALEWLCGNRRTTGTTDNKLQQMLCNAAAPARFNITLKATARFPENGHKPKAFTYRHFITLRKSQTVSCRVAADSGARVWNWAPRGSPGSGQTQNTFQLKPTQNVIRFTSPKILATVWTFRYSDRWSYSVQLAMLSLGVRCSVSRVR